MLRCDGCGASATAGYDGFCHGADCGVTPSGNWRAQPGHVYVAGAHNFQQQAEEAMRNVRALDAQRTARQNQAINQIQQMPSAMLIRPDDVAKWELFNAGQGSLAGGADEMDRLRRENLALQAEMKRCHDDNQAIRRASSKMLELKEGYRVKNTNLEMVVADLRGSLATEFNIRVQTENELMWAKKEVHRLDPKLASARWGWGK